MNQKEEFVQKLIEDTENNSISWTADPATALAAYVLNPQQIVQAFRTEKGLASVFYVIQKYPQYHSDLDQYFETTVHFINVISSGTLALSINSSEVSEKYMDDLISVIRNQAETAFLNTLLQ